MSSKKPAIQTFSPQHQNHQPGIESEMVPLPEAEDLAYVGSNKLLGKVAIITGGDSGIGRAVAIAFAKEGADIVIAYLNEHDDAKATHQRIEELGRKCLFIPGDLGDENHCKKVVTRCIDNFNRLDVLVNNCAEQHPQKRIEDITTSQLERTFRTNIFSYFHMTKSAMPHLKPGSTIINTTSATAYAGHDQLLDYSATKGAIVTYTRSLSQMLAPKSIRVNGVAPGPIWTPLIPSTFAAEDVATHGGDTPIGRAGQPRELAPAYVYLASGDSSYMTGQILHINGGTIVNG